MKKNHGKGFTLVELVVVLALMAILMSVAIFGGLAWQDWVRFNHEEATAQDIFFAAQNQLISLDSSGAMEEKIENVLKEGSTYNPAYVLASPGSYSKLEKIAYKNGSSSDSKVTYKWDTIWSTYLQNNDKNRQSAYIITLSAKAGDFDIYNAMKGNGSYDGEETISTGTELLFDIITPFISDRSVLNSAIILEFSPEAGQVFSVCYSDRIKRFEYSGSSTSSVVGVNDRRLQIRREEMFGYYSVDQLYEKLNGKEVINSDLRLEIRNNQILELVLHDNTGVTIEEGDDLQFKLFKGDTGITNNAAMTFNIGYKKHVEPDGDEHTQPVKSTYKEGLAEAMASPTSVEIQFAEGKYAGETHEFRLPVWIDQRGDMHIVLDAADIQAESYAYYKAFIREGGTDAEIEQANEEFRNTYSFYRFGLSQVDSSDIHYVYGTVLHTNAAGQPDDNPTESSRFVNASIDSPDGFIFHTSPDLIEANNGRAGECTTFENYDKSGGNDRHIEIKNARHLFNIRYETDYKKSADITNEFKLVDNIDWLTFVGKKASSDNETKANFFLNSYDETVNGGVVAGINYPGNNIATGGHGREDTVETGTADCPFPGFRCLSKGDVFTQETPAVINDDYTVEESDDSYTISNLTISFTANIVYGVYDSVFFDKTLTESDKDKYAEIKRDCLKGNFSGMTKFTGTAPFPGSNYQNNMTEDSGSSSLSGSGRFPVGLFAENLGTISNITLDKHVVKGMEVLTGSEDIIYTCMAGGFAGCNYGSVDNLALLNSEKDSENSTENKSHINGRTDVGGIVGRVSFSSSETDKDMTIGHMFNEAEVTGYEYVGGIVGRAYVHYLNDKDNTDMVGTFTSDAQKSRYKYYHDGYKITDQTEPRSMSGERVYRAKSVTIEECTNIGRVSGDKYIYNMNPAYNLDKVTTSTANKYVHAAFIGGIAGATIDGYISDGGSNVTEYINGHYYDGAFAYVTVNNCDSRIMYKKSEIDEIAEAFDTRTSENRDCYVGGLVGYAKFTEFKDCYRDKKDYFGDSETKYSMVIGRNYVGGLVGCSDESRFVSSDTSKADGYNAVNDNLVIGERYVGGIAGGAGIGDSDRNTLDFRNPAGNEASAPVGPAGNSSREVIKNVLNRGIVLGQRSAKVFEKRLAGNEGGIAEYNTKQGAAAIGGVVGSLCVSLQNADNIQSESTKKFALGLIGFDDAQIADFDNLATETVSSVEEDSKYGGNRVGGIVGSLNGEFYINRLSSSTSESCSSKVDAVVFGQDIVGGGFGYSYYDHDTVYNIYPSTATEYSKALDGMIVIGRDSVGGLIGACWDNNNAYFNTSDSTGSRLDDPISTPYAVYGRAGVGGVIGYLGIIRDYYGRDINVNISMSGDKTVSVNGIAFAGGFAGVADEKPYNVTGTISGVNVNAKYFAGGYYGAVPSKLTLDKFKDGDLLVNSVNVKAGIFAGGVAGLGYNSTGYDYFVKVDGSSGELADKTLGTLNKLFASSLQTTDGYVDVKTAFNNVVNKDVNGENAFAADKLSSYTFDMTKDDKPYTSVTTVEAELFAGGLFGYIPEGTKMTIKNFVNNGKVTATGYVGGDSTATVVESVESEDKYAYLGAVVGRVPKGTTIEKCNNLKSGADYSAPNATYLGGLTEVNAGVIGFCVNDTDFSYESGGVGAFAGMNGTDKTYISYNDELVINYGSSTGLIHDCKNNAAITSTNGFAGGMAAADSGTTDDTEGRRTAAISNCVNIGAITSGESAGMVCKSGGSDIIGHCRNYGDISGTNGRYGMTARTVGDIYKNMDAGNIDPETNINDPLAPMNSQDLTRNFYISDNVEESDVEEGIDLDNVGNIYFELTTQPGNTMMSNLLPAYYNQEDSIREITGRSRLISSNAPSDFYVKYNVKGDFVETGVKMNYFKIVWSDGNWVSNMKYVYYVQYEYIDINGDTQTTEWMRREVTQDQVVVIDSIPAPHGKDIRGVTSITIKATYEDNVGTTEYQQNNVQLLYYCAYWTDSSYKHFIWDQDHTEFISVGDSVYFKSMARDNSPSPEEESGTDDRHPAVYNLQPQLTTPVSDADLETRFKKISVGTGYDRVYQNDISVESPTTGIEGDFFRIYWLYQFWQTYQFKYTIAFTYLDDVYEEQTIYYDRVINKMVDPDYNTPGAEETGYHMLDQMFYDEIPMKDVDGNKIKPVKIQLFIDSEDAAAEYYYSAMSWGYYTVNGAGETVRTERIISDYDNRYTTDDPDNGYINTVEVDSCGKYVPADHDTAAENVRYTYRGDYWSKQLIVLHDLDGKYNLVYKRHGLYRLSKRLFALPVDSDINTMTPEMKYETLDEWFMNMFIDNETVYPDLDFAGEAE